MSAIRRVGPAAPSRDGVAGALDRLDDFFGRAQHFEQVKIGKVDQIARKSPIVVGKDSDVVSTSDKSLTGPANRNPTTGNQNA